MSSLIGWAFDESGLGTSSENNPGAHFTKDFSLKFKFDGVFGFT